MRLRIGEAEYTYVRMQKYFPAKQGPRVAQHRRFGTIQRQCKIILNNIWPVIFA